MSYSSSVSKSNELLFFFFPPSKLMSERNACTDMHVCVFMSELESLLQKIQEWQRQQQRVIMIFDHCSSMPTLVWWFAHYHIITGLRDVFVPVDILASVVLVLTASQSQAILTQILLVHLCEIREPQLFGKQTRRQMTAGLNVSFFLGCMLIQCSQSVCTNQV